MCVLMCMSMCVHVEGYAHVWSCMRKPELSVRGLLQSLSTLYFETVSPTKMRTKAGWWVNAQILLSPPLQHCEDRDMCLRMGPLHGSWGTSLRY